MRKIVRTERQKSPRLTEAKGKRDRSFVNITKSPSDRVQNVANRSFLPQAIAGDGGARL